ncbi:sulfatase-like hydrolase/transferase [Alteromonas aestuariivivens]|nr:sulfatase-like hydrolase/transferase [Alteromonas aestuariivivens]
MSDKPPLNILWLVIEDMSPLLNEYGDNTLATPNISSLASEGVVYTNVFSPSGVCAPSRAAIALGMYPSAVGANNMRTTSNTQETGLPSYEAVPPAEAKMLSQYLRELGYYTTNNLKEDYQFKAPKTAWHDSSALAHWRDRAQRQPFFAVVNFTTTHESGLFEPYGFREIEFRHYLNNDKKAITALPQHHSVKTTEADTPVHLPKDTDFNIPPYLPDTPVVRRDMWKMYNNLAETDRQIGAVLQQLKDDGLYDSTIIVFYSDHGGPLPRQKRLIYDSGLKVPMFIRFPHAKGAGARDDQLISFVDLAPTTIALAGGEIPSHMHGRNFLGQNTPARKYIHAAVDRLDEYTDAIRAVRDKQFKYIRNYRPNQGYYLPLAYREKIPSMQELLRLKASGQLSEAQAQWFRSQKPAEELFDVEADPHELNNLAGLPEYADTLHRLSSEMDRWLAQIGDTPNLPESELIAGLWQGQNTQPQTAQPVVEKSHGKISLTSPTPGANISYSLGNSSDASLHWQPYYEPFEVETGTAISVIAHRIGYQESLVVTLGCVYLC